MYHLRCTTALNHDTHTNQMIHIFKLPTHRSILSVLTPIVSIRLRGRLISSVRPLSRLRYNILSTQNPLITMLTTNRTLPINTTLISMLPLKLILPIGTKGLKPIRWPLPTMLTLFPDFRLSLTNTRMSKTTINILRRGTRNRISGSGLGRLFAVTSFHVRVVGLAAELVNHVGGICAFFGGSPWGIGFGVEIRGVVGWVVAAAQLVLLLLVRYFGEGDGEICTPCSLKPGVGLTFAWKPDWFG